MVLVVSAARAATPPANVSYALSWTRMPGAEACVAGGPLSRTVEERLKHSTWVPASTADVLIEGYVEKRRESSGWHAHIVLATAGGEFLGERDISHDDIDCEAMTKPLALMLALIIDPQLLLTGEVHEPPPLVTPPATPETNREPIAVTPPPVTEKRRSAQSHAQLGVGLAMGLLPGIATGLVLNEAVAIGPSTIELGGALWFPRETSVDPNRRVMLSLVEVATRLCPITRFEPGYALRVCGGAQGGVMVAQGLGSGFSELRSEARPAACLSASLQGAVHMAGPVWVGLRLNGLLPLFRQNFVYARSGAEDVSLFRMAVVAGGGDLLLSAQF
jgi:hypothetical protein